MADLRALFGGEFGKEFVDDAGDIMHAHQGEGGTFGIRATQERFDRGVLRAETGEGLESGVGDARIGIGEERSDGGSCVLHALACRGDGGFAAGPRIGAFRGIGDPGCGQRSEIASRTQDIGSEILIALERIEGPFALCDRIDRRDSRL